MSKHKRELDGVGGGGLTHNPFAALRSAADSESAEPREDGRSGDATPAPEGAPRARVGGGSWLVRRERKGRGGKVVTLVTPRGVAADLEELARTLARQLGTGARAKGGEVVLQGDLTARVRDALVDAGGEVTLGN